MLALSEMIPCKYEGCNCLVDPAIGSCEMCCAEAVAEREARLKDAQRDAAPEPAALPKKKRK